MTASSESNQRPTVESSAPLSVNGEGTGEGLKPSLAAWREQAASAADYLARAESIASQVETVLRARYDEAQAAGDQPKMLEIVAHYEHVTQLTTMIRSYDAIKVGAGVTIERLGEGLEQAVGELHSIMQAIDTQDESHPAVGEFAEIIREDAREDLDFEIEEARENERDQVMQIAGDESREALRIQIGQFLSAYFGVSPAAAERFCDALLGHCSVLNLAELLTANGGIAPHYTRHLDWYADHKESFAFLGAAIDAVFGEASNYRAPEE